MTENKRSNALIKVILSTLLIKKNGNIDIYSKGLTFTIPASSLSIFLAYSGSSV